MKSQDILILLKLICIQLLERDTAKRQLSYIGAEDDWKGWTTEGEIKQLNLPPINEQEDPYSLRNIQNVTGVSKTEISASINRSIGSGLAIRDRKTNKPKANTQALLEFLIYGVKYVFPVKPGEIVRGIPTSFSAPVMSEKLMTAGEIICVWPDAYGNKKGQAIVPLFKSVPKAVKIDPYLYELLALVDALRLGNARESVLAKEMLKERLGG
ncbi:MAG: hypothetical protein RPR91_05170 [Colwellia sp.]|jgi:hypothetical protein